MTEAFMREVVDIPVQRKVLLACEALEDAHPTAAPGGGVRRRVPCGTRSRPSGKQLCLGLGWKKQGRGMWNLIAQRLIADGWLTNTSPVPWTLRPGKAAVEAAATTGPVQSPRTVR
ncbi:hypothetical protein NKH18_05920 [Streptomyces sp. M10(2022)]